MVLYYRINLIIIQKERDLAKPETSRAHYINYINRNQGDP